MKILVYGAGVLGSLYAARLHEAGHEVSLLARGERLAALRERGVLLAEADSSDIRSVPVPIVDHPEGNYDLALVLVRTHQVDGVLESLTGLSGDVLLLLNWAAGPQQLDEVLGGGRLLLGFPTLAGTKDGEVVRYRTASALTRLVSMPIGEPDGQPSARLERIVEMFNDAGIKAKAESKVDAWLKTHAAFEVPLGRAVRAAGGTRNLSDDTDAIRAMVRLIRQNLAALQTPPVPRAFGALRTVPEGLLVPVFRRFLRSAAAAPLDTDSPAVHAELERLAQQLQTMNGSR